MKSIIALLLFSSIFPVFAGEVRITPELAIVKTCAGLLKNASYTDFDLKNIYKASSTDSGKFVTVTLNFSAMTPYGMGDCIHNSYFRYDGTETTNCTEICQQDDNCECFSEACTVPERNIRWKR